MSVEVVVRRSNTIRNFPSTVLRSPVVLTSLKASLVSSTVSILNQIVSPNQVGYDKVLRVAGRHYRDFLHGIDNLHETIRFTYPRMLSPSFLVEQEDRHGCVLLYRSARRGFSHYVMVMELCSLFVIIIVVFVIITTIIIVVIVTIIFIIIAIAFITV